VALIPKARSNLLKAKQRSRFREKIVLLKVIEASKLPLALGLKRFHFLYLEPN